MTDGIGYFLPARGARSCHGSTSRAVATFAIQSSVGLVSSASTAKSCERETAAKSASTVNATPFRFAAARTFFATSERSAEASTPSTLRAVFYAGLRYAGWSQRARSNRQEAAVLTERRELKWFGEQRFCWGSC